MYESARRIKRVRKHRARTGKRVNRSTGGNIVMVVFLALVALFMAMPLYLTLINSFKPLNELWTFPPKFYVVDPSLKNYQDLFSVLSNSESTVPLSRYLFNTVFVTVVGTVGQVIISSMCAYPLAKHKFPGAKIYSGMVTLSLMFSATVTAIPNYIIMSKLGLVDSYFAVLLPIMGSSLGLYLIRNFIAEIPDSILESARIDGAGEYRIFWRIIMPNIRPAWLTVALLSVQSLWNMGSSNFIYSENLKSLNYALSQIVSVGVSRAGVAAAVSVLMLIVPVAFFLFSQSNVMETMTHSGLKD